MQADGRGVCHICEVCEEQQCCMPCRSCTCVFPFISAEEQQFCIPCRSCTCAFLQNRLCLIQQVFFETARE